MSKDAKIRDDKAVINPGRKSGTIFPFIFLLLLPFIVYFPVTFGQATFAGFDHTGINQPLKQAAFESLRNGELPIWEHRLDRGLPLLAEGEAGIFYPLNWLFLIPGDFLTIYNIVLLLSIGLGGIFLYMWVRKLGVGPVAAILASITHQFGSTINFNKANLNILEGYILAPLLLYFLEPDSDKKRDNPLLRTVGISAVIACMVFAGQAQYVIYTGLFAFFYVILRIIFSGRIAFQAIKLIALPLIFGSILGFILSAIQLLPQLELIPLSERGAGVLSNNFAIEGLWLSPARLFATFIFPVYHYSVNQFLPYLSTTCWIGPIALFLAVFSFRSRAGNPRVLPLIIAGLVFLYLSMGSNAPFAGEITSWGPLGSFRGHGRFSGYFALAALSLMSIGLDQLLIAFKLKSGKLNSSGWIILFSLILMLLLAIPFITSRSEYLETKFALALFAIFVLVFLIGFFLSASLKSPVPIVTGISLALLIQIAGFYSTSSETLLSRASWDSDRPDLLYIRDNSASPDEATYIAIRTQASVRLHERILREGIQALTPGPHDHIDHLGSANAGLMENMSVMNADIPLEFMEWERLMHQGLWQTVDTSDGELETMWVNLLWIMGVNWVVTENGNLIIPGFEKIEDQSFKNRDIPFYIHKREWPVRPYDYFRSYVSPEGDTVEELRSEFDTYLETVDAGSTIFLEGEVNEAQDEQLYQSRTTIEGEWVSSTEYVAEVNTTNDLIFMVRDQWYPGWSASIDGEPVEILKANLVFKALRVPSGDHTVRFIYTSGQFQMGFILTSTALILLLILGFNQIFTAKQI